MSFSFSKIYMYYCINIIPYIDQFPFILIYFYFHFKSSLPFNINLLPVLCITVYINSVCAKNFYTYQQESTFQENTIICLTNFFLNIHQPKPIFTSYRLKYTIFLHRLFKTYCLTNAIFISIKYGGYFVTSSAALSCFTCFCLCTVIV